MKALEILARSYKSLTGERNILSTAELVRLADNIVNHDSNKVVKTCRQAAQRGGEYC